MAGRGAVADPSLLRQFQGGAPADKEELRQFHALVYAGYQRVMSGDRAVLARMKELWFLPAVQFHRAGTVCPAVSGR